MFAGILGALHERRPRAERSVDATQHDRGRRMQRRLVPPGSSIVVNGSVVAANVVPG
jgi:hypothetical protein